MTEPPACPACERPLQPVIELEQPLLRCPECAGAFFRGDELPRYVVASTFVGVGPVYEQLLARALAEAPRDSTSIRGCPLCQAKLLRFGFGERPLAILDRCPSDGAIWLDAGDLSKVVRACRSEALVTGAVGDADADGVPDPLDEAAQTSAEDETPAPEPEGRWACPNCAKVFDGDPKCPDCNVVGYER